MAKVTLDVCDVCMAADRLVQSYRITTPVESARTLLCAEHAGPLVSILRERGKRRRKPRRFEAAKATMAEIEALKQARANT